MIQKTELEIYKVRVATDPLTGVKSKHAYIDAEEEIENRINGGNMEAFAIVVFDLNDLKIINDKQGHKAGDQYIIDATHLIKEYFPHNELYRVGGDEFALFLMGEDYQNRKDIYKAFDEKMHEHVVDSNKIAISFGTSDYLPNKDTTILQTFTREDAAMYKYKADIKTKKMQL